MFLAERQSVPYGDGYKTVLLWTKFHNIKHWWNEGTSGFQDCPQKKCAVTTDRKMLQYSSAVLFHVMDLETPGISDLPRMKPEGQSWIFRSLESPKHVFLGHKNYTDLRALDGLFDLTMTYKRDSDIPEVYGWMKKKMGKYDDLPKNHFDTRTKFALWFVTNCNLSEHSKTRFDMVTKMQKYIPIDIFGPCGKPDPCRQHTNNPVKWWQCTTLIKRQYKFYIAFENSICTDYITERFWWALYQGVVPVVLGPKLSNYQELAPPYSYIHVNQYRNLKHLAEYLKQLSENKYAYLEYYHWREKYDIMIGPREHPWCQLCDILHRRPPSTRRSYNISKYFGKKTNCDSEYSSPGLTEDLRYY